MSSERLGGWKINEPDYFHGFMACRNREVLTCTLRGFLTYSRVEQRRHLKKFPPLRNKPWNYNILNTYNGGVLAVVTQCCVER